MQVKNLTLLLVVIGLFSCTKNETVIKKDNDSLEPRSVATVQVESYVNKTPFLDLKAKCSSAIEAMEFIKTEPVDLLFLDIQMPDLTGIESFTNLTTLRCHGNSLTTLDISNNTNLIELNCSNNALSTLDLTNNTDLTQLSCSSNSLTSLDVSNNSALTFIDCGANAITSIDLSNNPVLTTFGCNFNSTLMTLDLSNNSILTEMYCNNTPITALNVANGNNNIITTFAATNTPNLTCIQVDDVNYSITNWTNIDPTSSFSLDCGTLGINDLELSKNISLYPNPAQSQIQLNSNETIKFVSIIDTFGKTIKVNLTNTSGINISDLSSGIYFLRIHTDKGMTIKKFIKD